MTSPTDVYILINKIEDAVNYVEDSIVSLDERNCFRVTRPKHFRAANWSTSMCLVNVA